jgi:hypothetical protein
MGELGEATPEQMAEVAGRAGLEVDLESIPRICAEHGLTHPMLAMFEGG